MANTDLDTLAKAPLLVYLAISGTNSGPTATDIRRFNEFIEEAIGANARMCAYTDVMRHLAGNYPRLQEEVCAAGNTAPLIQAVQPVLGQKMPADERFRFVSHLGRIAFSAARDDTGTPIPERIAVSQQLQGAFGFPGYASYSKRFTDGMEITNYWPGNDPALQRFSDAELRKLAAVFGLLFAALSGCHAGDIGDAKEASVKQWLMAGYAVGQEACPVHALLRYLDQLFMLVGMEVQYAQGSQPVFVEGLALMKEKLSEPEQAMFMQFFHALGAVIVTSDSPAVAHDMLKKITSLMKGEPVEYSGSGLTDKEWDVLSLGLVASFLLVAAADGKVGAKETQAFTGIVYSMTEVANLGLAVQAAARIPDNMHRLLPLVTSGKIPPPQFVLEALEVAATRLAEVEFHAYRRIAMMIAEETAKAEGGGFLGFGSKISAEERKVLDGLKKLLGFT
ncbi:MAG TPA: hypothetical protein PLB55_12510 [Prosthecobacter sp.]|nr:hypothetical protein [Prosthecobacter sp.]